MSDRRGLRSADAATAYGVGALGAAAGYNRIATAVNRRHFAPLEARIAASDAEVAHLKTTKPKPKTPEFAGWKKEIGAQTNVTQAMRTQRKAMTPRMAAKHKALLVAVGAGTGVPALWAGSRRRVRKDYRRRDYDRDFGAAVAGGAVPHALARATDRLDTHYDNKIKANPEHQAIVNAHRKAHGDPKEFADPKWNKLYRSYPKEVPGGTYRRVAARTLAGKGLLVSTGVGAAGAVTARHKVNKSMPKPAGFKGTDEQWAATQKAQAARKAAQKERAAANAPAQAPAPKPMPAAPAPRPAAVPPPRAAPVQHAPPVAHTPPPRAAAAAHAPAAAKLRAIGRWPASHRRAIALPAGIAAVAAHLGGDTTRHREHRSGSGAAEGAGGALAGQAAFRATGYKIKAAGVKRERELPPGMSRSQHQKIVSEHKHRHGLGGLQGEELKRGINRTPSYAREYPKELPAAPYKRVLGHMSGGRGLAINTAATGVPALAMTAHGRRQQVHKSAGGAALALPQSPVRSGAEVAGGAALLAWGLPRLKMTGAMLAAGRRTAAAHNSRATAAMFDDATNLARSVEAVTGRGEMGLRRSAAISEMIDAVPAPVRAEVATAAGLLLVSAPRRRERRHEARIRRTGRW